MWIYIVTFVLSLFMFLLISPNRYKINGRVRLYHNGKINKVRMGVFFSFLPPFIIAACRYYVGTDYLRTYYTGFYRILEGNKVDGFEPGYYLLNKFIQLFTDNVFWLIVITSLIFVGFVYKSIGDISENIPLSIILFLITRYYFVGMNGVRQFMGMAILTYSLKYLYEDEEKRKFFFCVVLACSFHYMCILFIPVFFLPKIELSKKRIVLAIGLTLVLFTYGVSTILKIITGTKYALLTQKYGVCGLKFTLFTIVLNLFLFLIGYCGYEQRKNDIKYRLFLNIEFMALLVSLVIRSIPLMERVYWFFSFPIVITFPYLSLSIEKKKTRKIIVLIMIAIFFVYMIYDISVLGDHNVLPYDTIFGKMPIHYSGREWY